MQMFSYSLKIEQISLGKVICQFMSLLAIIWTLARTYLRFLFTYKMEKNSVIQYLDVKIRC